MGAAAPRRQAGSRSPGSMWALGGLEPRELARRVLKAAEAADLTGRAAQLAFYFLFALFPLLLSLTTMFAFVISDSHEVQHRLLTLFDRLVPGPVVSDLIHDLLHEIITQRGSGKLSFGLLAALWLASSGMAGVIRSLNSSLGARRFKDWWRRRAIALALTLAFSVLTVVSLALTFYGAAIGTELRRLLGIEAAFWNLVRWSAVLFTAVVSFDVIYNFAPNLDAYPRRWLSPGATFAAAVWIGASVGLRTYVGLLDASRVYGSLGAIILLLAWFYLTAAALLLGGAINATICRAEGLCR